jgi:hypothetical protein
MAATVAPILLTVAALVLNAFGIQVPGLQAEFPVNLYAVVGFTTIVWLAATFLTRPTADETLDEFYRTVHPGGPGWAPVAERHPDVTPDQGLGRLAVDWVLGVVLVYATLFGTGYLILGWTVWGLGGVTVAGVAATLLWRDLQRDAVSLFDPDVPENST